MSELSRIYYNLVQELNHYQTTAVHGLSSRVKTEFLGDLEYR